MNNSLSTGTITARDLKQNEVVAFDRKGHQNVGMEFSIAPDSTYGMLKQQMESSMTTMGGGKVLPEGHPGASRQVKYHCEKVTFKGSVCADTAKAQAGIHRFFMAGSKDEGCKTCLGSAKFNDARACTLL